MGALAVALGVAGAVATSPGVARADDGPASGANSNASSSQDSSNDSTPTTHTSTKESVAKSTDDSGTETTVASGSATTTTHDSESSSGADTSHTTDSAADDADETHTNSDDPDADDAADAEPSDALDDTGAEPPSDEPVAVPVKPSGDVEPTDGTAPTPTPPVTATPAESESEIEAPSSPQPQAPVLTTGTTTTVPTETRYFATVLAHDSPVVADASARLQSPNTTSNALLVTAAAAPAARPAFKLPTPAQVINQIKTTVTDVFTKCACALINGVQAIIKSFSSIGAQPPSDPSDPAQTPILWTIVAWVRKQADYAVAAFNRSPVGVFVHEAVAHVRDVFQDTIGNSPFGRQISSRIAQFLEQCNGSTALPAEFDRTAVVTGLTEPTDFAFLTHADDPDDVERIFITEKSGAVKSYDPHTGQLTTLVSVAVVTAAGERGLIGIEVDPHFWARGEDGYHTIYVAYTGADNYDRLSSLLVNEALDDVEETVLVKSDQLANEFHHGGEIAFDPEGNHLYWAVGNNTVSPNSQDLTNIHGKILRLNRDGSAPADNPFVGDPSAEPRIFAYGFRNPFRFTFTPNGTLLAGDVGEATWEELNVVTAGANYGWPGAEGPCAGCGYVDPLYAYHHSGPPSNTGSITSVAVYTGTTFPASYQNTVFIADYSLGWIKQLTFDSEYSSLISERLFDSGAGAVVKLAQGPDENLYQLNIYPGTLSVIAPSGGNRAPTAVITSSATSGAGNSLAVDFSATGSSDADGDAVTYRWNFGNGTTSTEANPTAVFTNSGAYTAYTVTLTVDDGAKQSVATQRIVVGSTPPQAEISVSNDKYNAGDTVTFSATAFDDQDGALPDSAYSWKVEFHHADHLHPFRDNVIGPENSITIPREYDQLYNTYYRIILTVTDQSGLSTTKSVDVRPNLVTLTFGANDPDATYTIDGVPHRGQYSELGVVGVQRTLNAPSPQYVRGQQVAFGSWSDGGAQNHVIVTPGTSTGYEATFDVVPSAAALA